MMAGSQLLLFALFCCCTASILPDSVYEGSEVVSVDDKGRSPQRHLLLSVLLNLNKILGPVKSDVRDYSAKTESQLSSNVDSSDLERILEDKITASKRARSDLSGVLPPWNEFCRMMHITSCVHSRQR